MIDYPPIALEMGQQITFNLVNGMGGSGIIEHLDYTEDGGLRELGIRDDPTREDLLYVRGDLVAVWRPGPSVPPTPQQQVPRGHILIPAGQLPPDIAGPNHGRG